MSPAVDRREFLRRGSGTLAATCLAGAAVAGGRPRALKKAVMYATIGLPGSVAAKFRALRTAGFDGVEPMSHMNQKEVLDALAATGLKAASVCCDTHWSRPLSHPDEAVRREGREGLVQALRDARCYGAGSVLLVPGVVNARVSYDDCFHRSVAEIRRVVSVAAELGVKIAIENVWNNFITTPEQAVAYLNAIGSPHVGWHFDIGNAVRYSPPETWIPVLGRRILKLHIKEYSRVKGFGVRFFEGDDHWPVIMQALDAVGYQGWGISEQPGDQSKDSPALVDLSARMDRIFAS